MKKQSQILINLLFSPTNKPPELYYQLSSFPGHIPPGGVWPGDEAILPVCTSSICLPNRAMVSSGNPFFLVEYFTDQSAMGSDCRGWIDESADVIPAKIL